MNTRWLPALWLLFAGIAHAAGFQSIIVDCANLDLADAHGVGDANAAQHTFKFSGSCRLSIKGDGYTQDVRTFPVEANARWFVADQRFEETLRILGAFKWDGKVVGGQMTSSFKCNDDPLAAHASCNGFNHQNKTALEALSNSYKQQGRPLLVGLTTGSEVLAKSAEHPKVQPGKQATVPPPKKTPPGLKSTSEMDIAPHVTIRSPKAGQVLSGGTVHLDVAGTASLIHEFGVSAVRLEWEWAAYSERLPNRPSWKMKPMLQSLKWNGQEGPVYFAVSDIPASRFAESSKWRVRARTTNASIEPTAWVEFSVVPLGAAP